MPGSTVALFVEGLLGLQQRVDQSAGVADQGDAGLDRVHAAGAQLLVAVVEGEQLAQARARVLFLALVTNGFNLLGVDADYQRIFQGLLILAAITVAVWGRREQIWHGRAGTDVGGVGGRAR